MADFSIMFTSENVRRHRTGTKTMTRRMAQQRSRFRGEERGTRPSLFTYVKVGDLLWVMEKWARIGLRIFYQADLDAPRGTCWQTATSLDRAMSRTTLEITQVRREHLHQITKKEAQLEGVASVEDYALLWNMLHGPGAWRANPEVVVMAYCVHEVNIDGYRN